LFKKKAISVDALAGQDYTKFCPNLVLRINLEPIMEVAKRFRPISYLKTNTADVAKELADSGTVVITQNGIPAFVCVSFEDYYRSQETNALLKLVNMGEKEKAAGKLTPLAQAKLDMEAAIFGDRAAKLKAG
jgi:prevent-host-death family protein